MVQYETGLPPSPYTLMYDCHAFTCLTSFIDVGVVFWGVKKFIELFIIALISRHLTDYLVDAHNQKN